MKDEALAERCRRLRLILTDVDGVMTDGTVLLLPDGQEARSFHIRDGLAVVLAHEVGLKTACLPAGLGLGSRRAAELKMAVVRARMAKALRDLARSPDSTRLTSATTPTTWSSRGVRSAAPPMRPGGPRPGLHGRRYRQCRGVHRGDPEARGDWERPSSVGVAAS
jgi:hypothetical protein